MKTHKIRNENEEIITDATEIHRIIDCYEQLCANKLHNQEEIDTSLETYNVLKLNQE